MDSLKILIPYPTGHETTSIRTILFNNLIPILKQKVNIKIQRVLYQPEKISKKFTDSSEIISLDLRDYKNAFDVIKKEKPDIIYANPYPGFIDYAFSFAGKMLNIPVVSISIYSLRDVSSMEAMKTYGRKFFSNNVEIEINKNKKSFMRRGKFILYKFNFLLKTLFSSKLNFFQILKKIFQIFDIMILRQPKYIDPRLSVTMHYLRNKIQEKELLSVGFESSKLLVTGHPMFDHSFKKIKSIKQNSDSEIHVLVAPDPLYEAGIWTKEQRDSSLSKIITILSKNKNDFSIKVKIHPSSGLISEYEPLIHSINSSIPIFQKGSIEDFLDDTDVVVAYSSSSTGLLYALIAKKPIVICNFFQDSNVGASEGLLENQLAVECNDPNLLKEIIQNSLKIDSLYEERRIKFIQKYFFKDDGKASERISESLLKLAGKI